MSCSSSTLIPPDQAILRDSIDAHRASPEIDLRRHSRNRQVELAKSLRHRRAIYLDIKFWIGLRDADASGIANSYGDLLKVLRLAVSAEHVFCPISDSCFLELFKQSDPTTRRRTTELIDELSLGITIIPFDLRIGTEIAHLLHAARMPNQVFALDELVWTKLSYVLGYYEQTCCMFDADTERAIQKAFFDYMWTISLSEIQAIIGDTMLCDLPDHYVRLADKLTQGIQANAASLKSLEQAYEHELVGVLDLYASRAADIVCDMTPSQAPRPVKGSDEYKDIEGKCLGLMVAAMKTECGKATLRTLHIETYLHAALRWNKGQRFKPNDFFDYKHASAAVGYCDAFFTERSLCSVLTRSDLALDRLYGCTVVSTPEAALEYVRAISLA